MKEILENRQVGRGFEFLRKIDIFGVPIQINFNNESKHTTRVGGIVSLSIFGLLVTYLLNLIIQIQDRSNPSVIQEELIVTNPALYNLTDKNFGFAITLLDENYTPFLDETYYTVKSTFLYKVTEVMADGTTGQVFKTKDIDLEPCTSSSFQVEGTQQFFLSQAYQNLYCIKDLNSLFLVGQFDQPDFSDIQIWVSVCSGSNCQSPSEIQRKLSVSQLQVYYSNSIVRISDIKNPFQPIGQSLFWYTNLNQAQVITLTYKNTYVIDDVGLFSSDLVTKSNLLYSDNRTMYNTDASSYIYYISIFMEKNRETQYTRKFMKLTEAFSQVGGIYNVLFFIGCMLAQPYSYLELERKLVNSTFSFSSDFASNRDEKSTKEPKKSIMSKKKEDSEKDKKSEHNTNFLSPALSSRSEFPQQTNRQKINSEIRVLSTFSKKDNNMIRDKKQTGLSETQNQNSEQLMENNPQETIGNKVSNTFSEIKLKTKEYFYNYLRCFKFFDNDTQKIMSFGTRKICEFTDICFIVNKLIELEKMKHLLLNDQQLKLFEYIPKPKVTKSVIESYDQAVGQNQQITKAIKENSIFSLNQLVENNKQITDKPSQLNILTIMNRSSLEKAREAQKAYNNIYKQQIKLTSIDSKLLKLLDENHLPLFNANQFDSSAFLDVKKRISKVINNQFQYQDNQIQKPNTQDENKKEEDDSGSQTSEEKRPQNNIDQQKGIIEELLNAEKTKTQEIYSPPSRCEQPSLPIISMEELAISQQINNNQHSNQYAQYNFEQKNIIKSPFQL